jgi:hypothetical protein
MGPLMALLYLATACFVAGLITLFWYPKYPKQVRIAVVTLWGVATAIRTIWLLPRH